MTTPAPTLAAAFAACVLLTGCGEKAADPAPVRPVLSKVVVQNGATNVAITGTVQPQLKTEFSFRILGRLIARPVNIGDAVEKGQLLAAIDAAPLEPGVRSAVAQLSSAQGQLANAAAIEERQNKLIETGAITKATLESAQQSKAAADAAVVRAQSALTKAKEQLNYTKLTSDYAGIITDISAQVGQVVAPGQTVVTVARPDIREAVIDVADYLADALRIGMPLQVKLQLNPDIHVEGKVREIAPQSDTVTRSRRVRITLDNPPPAFRLGTTVTTLIPGQNSSGVRLPKTALLINAGKSSVWIINTSNKSVALRDVSFTETEDGSIDVTQGLSAGDRVVVAGVHQLKDGQKIRFEQDSAP